MRNGSAKTFWIINQYGSTPDTGIGGRHFCLARELSRKGHSVYLVTASYSHILRKPTPLTQSFAVETVQGVHHVVVRVPPYSSAHDKKRILNWFLFAWKLGTLPTVIPDQPSAILVSSPPPLSFLGAEWLARKYQCRLIFEVRDIWPLSLTELGNYTDRNIFIRFVQWLEDHAYRRADAVISNLSGAIRHMRGRGLRAEKFTWIPNGVSRRDFDTQRPLPDSIANKLPEDTFLIGYAGTFGVANVLDPLLDAAGLILVEKIPATIVLLGAGREKEHIQRRIKNEHLDNVMLFDRIRKDQVDAFLKKMNLCYLGLADTPLYAFGIAMNKMYDYLRSERPIILAASGKVDLGPYGLEEILIRTDCDGQSISRAIVDTMRLPDPEREQIGLSGKQYVLKHHDYEMLAAKLSNVLTGG